MENNSLKNKRIKGKVAEAVNAYCEVGRDTDPYGSYTGRFIMNSENAVNSKDEDFPEQPVQDADDL